MSDQEPDTRPGFYYVTAVDGDRFARLLGPFVNHTSALAAVDGVRAEAERRDPWASFWAFGTCRSETDLGPGALGTTLAAVAPVEPTRLWTSAFWAEARHIAANHGFEIVPGDHKDHYKLRPTGTRGRDGNQRRASCLRALRARWGRKWIS